MRVGIQFFPSIVPDMKSARDYWQEALSLVGLCDRYGYSHVRTVEHYSPAAAQNVPAVAGSKCTT
jgi:hypothetical protein